MQEINDFKIWAGSLVSDPLQGQEIGVSGQMQKDSYPYTDEELEQIKHRITSGTQPLTEDQQETLKAQDEMAAAANEAWNDLMNHPLVQAFREANKPPPHVHGPLTFLLNQNHNALRGCQSCGQTWVGVMAGTEDSIRWHEVQEPPEEEE